MSLPLTGVLLADARPQGSAQGGAQASPRPRARARGHQGPQAEPQGDAQLPQGGVSGPHQVQLLNMFHRPTPYLMKVPFFSTCKWDSFVNIEFD